MTAPVRGSEATCIGDPRLRCRSDERFRRAHRAFSAPRFQMLYRCWLTDGDAVFVPVSSTAITEALARGTARIESQVLLLSYDHLSPFGEARAFVSTRGRGGRHTLHTASSDSSRLIAISSFVSRWLPRATFDLDILIDGTQDNAQRLIDALLAAGLGTAALTSAEEILANEITVFKDRVRIDAQDLTPRFTFDDAWAHRISMAYQGQPFNVVSRADLIRAKRAAGRPVDLEDVRLLEARSDDEG